MDTRERVARWLCDYQNYGGRLPFDELTDAARKIWLDDADAVCSIFAEERAAAEAREAKLVEAAAEALNALLDYVPELEKKGGSMNYGRKVIKMLASALATQDAAKEGSRG